jgi:hypothetical protein
MKKIVLPIPSVLFRTLPVFVLLLSLSGTADSQTTSTSLTIRVVDQNGAVIPNATVVIKRKDGVALAAVTPQRTSDDGTVTFQNLPSGVYLVSVSVEGFKAVEKEMPVGITASTSLQVIMETEPPEDEVTRVREEPETVSALPNQNNDLTPALQVAPGALPLGSTVLGQVIVDGKGLDQLTARLDGIDFTVLAGMPSADPAIDPVSSFSSAAVANNLDKFTLRRGAFEARYGPGAGAISDIVTYTGFGRDKGKWTAEIYKEIQNDAFNSRNFFDLEGKNGLRRNRFGGKFSRSLDDMGRSNIFLAYDGMRGRVERPVYEAVPIDAVCCRSQPIASLMRSFVPAGTQILSGTSLNPDFLVARRRVRSTVNANAFDIRFEHNPFTIEDPNGQAVPKLTDFLTIRFTRQGAESVIPDGVTGRHQRQNILFNNLLVSFQFDTNLRTTHIIRYGLNATRARVVNEIPPESDPSLASSLITTSGTVAVTGLPGNTSSVGIASLGTVIRGAGRGFRIAPNSSSLSYEFQHKFEKHTLNAGIEGRLIRVGFDRLGGLSYSFPNVNALRTGTPSSVAFQSDLSAASPFSSGIGQRQARQEYAMGYIQMLSSIGELDEDPTFKNERNARLRITYGLRYDYFSPVRERDGRAVLIDPSTGAILSPGTSFYRTRKFNFQPRASFIYRFADDGFLGRTVLNGGAGVYSGTARTGDYLLPIDSDRFSTGMTGLPFPVDSSILINNFLTHPETRQFQPLTFARDFVGVERVYKWDMRLAHTISGYDIAVLYSGNVGRNLPLADIGNKIVSVVTNPDPTKTAIVQRQFDIVSGGQIFKPFGEFLFRTSDGRSSFDSLTIQFSRNRNARPIPTNNWLAVAVASFNAQYILSRSVGNVSGAVLSNPFDLNSDFGENIRATSSSCRPFMSCGEQRVQTLQNLF